jgi:hypothetical protein
MSRAPHPACARINSKQSRRAAGLKRLTIDLPIPAADDGIVTLKKRANSGIRLIIQCAREVARPVAKARE